MIVWIVMVLLISVVVVRERNHRKPDPSLEDRIEQAVSVAQEEIESGKHRTDVLEDISVSLMNLSEELEQLKWQ